MIDIDTPMNGEVQSATLGLGMWEYARTNDAKRVLMTPGLAPCIGIALYAPETAIGYMAHLSCTFMNAEPFWDYLVQEELGSNTRAWLRGGQINYVDDERLDSIAWGQENRSFAIESLISVGVDRANIDIEWDDRQSPSHPATIISLDADTGVFETRRGMLADAAAWFGELVVEDLLTRQPYGAPPTEVRSGN